MALRNRLTVLAGYRGPTLFPLPLLQAKGYAFEWADVIADLDALQQVHVRYQDKHFLLRSETKGSCGKVFQAVGVAVPSTVRPVAEQSTV